MNYDKLRRFTKNYLLECTWEREGNEILGENKSTLNMIEKEKLKFLISKSPPDIQTRKKLWLISSGAKKEIEINPNYYKNLLKFSETTESLNEHQINVDLKRTFPEEEFYRKEENIQRLKNILICYSLRNSSIGYCQGFNFIAARLLLILDDEEEVFWTFTQIIEDILPLNYYSELAGMITDCSILINFIEKYLPDLYKYLLSNNFELCLNNFIHKWFVSLFVQNFDIEFSLIIWDFFFLEGNIILFKAALAVLKILKREIMINPNFEEIYYILNVKTYEISQFENVYTDLIFYLSFRKFEFDWEFLQHHRQNLLNPIVENILKENEAKLKLKQKYKSNNEADSEKNVESKYCNPDDPICIVNVENNFQHKIIFFLAYRIKNFPPEIFDNYFDKNKSSDVINLFDALNENYPFDAYYQEDFLIERHAHKCILNYEIPKIIDKYHEEKNLTMRKKFSKLKLDEINTDEEQTDDADYLKLFTNIRQDRNFTLANNYLSKTFTPKPFDF